MVSPLSDEGQVPMCRDFSLQRLGTGYRESHLVRRVCCAEPVQPAKSKSAKSAHVGVRDACDGRRDSDPVDTACPVI